MPDGSIMQLESLIAHLPGAVYRCRNDRDWTMEFISDGCRGLTGYEPGDIVGNALVSYGRDIVHPEDQQAGWETVQSAIAAGRSFQLVYRVVTRSGEVRWVRERGHPVLGTDGDVEALEGLIVDITDQVAVQAELERSRRLLDTVVNTIQVGVNAKDADGRYIFINRYQVETYGLDPAQVMGRTPEDIWGSGLGAYFRDRDRRVVASGVSLGPYEEEIPDRNGVPRLWLSTKVPFKDESGGIGGVVTTSLDVTERVNSDRKLRQAQKMDAIGNLTAGVAHDFNNLLTVILGSADELDERAKNGEPIDRSVAAILGAGERARELIRRLLLVARRQPLVAVETELAPLIDEMGDLLRRTLDGGVRLEVTAADTLWPCIVDPGELQTALLNLALNARDAMPNGGSLRIGAANVALPAARVDEHGEVPAGEWVLLTVCDEGVGMTPEVLQSACDPFFTTKEAGLGTGLGLSMVRGFVEQSGGHVRIRSRPGEGTVVEIYLRRSSDERATPADAGSDQERGSANLPGGREAILVVEDDPLVRDHVSVQLRALGYTIMSASDGPGAMAFLRDGAPIDLLFTDVVMPGGMTGLDVANEARRLRPGLEVLYCSGYADQVIVDRNVLNGARFLRKPYRRVELARAVRAALDRVQAPALQ
jgi:PAS domain S-box-containing protein